MSVSVPRVFTAVRAAAPAAALAAILACVAAGPAAATGPGSATSPTPAPGPAEQAEQVKRTLRDVVDLQLLQPTCGEPGALTVAAVEALRTIGVEAKAAGVPKIDLGPLGWIGVGTQHPGRAVGLELHLLPTGPVPVQLTVGEKRCPADPVPRTPEAPAAATSPRPTTASPYVPRATPAAVHELATTGGGSSSGTYAAVGAGLFAAGLAIAAATARRRMR